MHEVDTIEAYIADEIWANQLELNTFMPANVIAYDAINQTVDVQPLLNTTYISPPMSVKKPQLLGIPIIFPKSSGNAIHIPLKKGDGVGVIFCQRSLDEWKTKGDVTSVLDTRLHDFTDAVAIAGLDIRPRQIPEPDKMSVLADNGLYIGKPTGTSGAIAGLSQTEVFQALSKLCDIVSGLTTITTSAGTADPVTNAVATTGTGVVDTAVQTQLSLIKAVFDEIGGN